MPTATDIAFALGVLALVGSRVPASLKVFLTSLAIIDDLGAILIIATFYASDLPFAALAVAAVFAATLYWLNRRGETPPLSLCPAWRHAVGGDAVLRHSCDACRRGPRDDNSASIMRATASPRCCTRMERGLSKWVAYLVLPIFAFANAGVSIGSTGHMSLISPLGLGIIGGLFLGKQLGVFAAVYLAKQARRRGASRPCQLEADLRRRCALRHRLHHESFHRLARLY